MSNRNGSFEAHRGARSDASECIMYYVVITCFPLKHFDGLKVTEFSERFSRKHVGRDSNDLMMIAIMTLSDFPIINSEFSIMYNDWTGCKQLEWKMISWGNTPDNVGSSQMLSCP